MEWNGLKDRFLFLHVLSYLRQIVHNLLSTYFHGMSLWFKYLFYVLVLLYVQYAISFSLY